MNNYTCKKCGLINWATDGNCRKCGTPNPAIRQGNRQTNPSPDNFGSEYGNPIGGETNYRSYKNHQTVDQSEIESAEKDIRLGWKAGRAWCILASILLIIIFSVGFVAGSGSPGGAAPFIFIFALIALPILAIGIGLTYGVYNKNRVCAVILFALTAFSVVSSLADLLMERQARGGVRVLLGLLFLYYFWCGVRGTFKYHKLIRN